ncbi:uncharacterized protein LOC131163079 [Malania oleifera]|uniref:uncharacterized protein LOC131163079 n=1 Tax=Malania oleifera TaxID=397392 RepID=UPI0025AE84DC|nr:uncharacterized protein LOC131163079 [Malania oleifera]XP_057975769.1 uncharacterized protein LOC131163079 [Malania oleifera]
MGSACCVAAKDRTLSNRTGGETLHRNVIYSPSWSFRWDNQGRVIGEIEDPSYQLSHGISRHVSMEMKGESGCNNSDGGSPLEILGTPASQRSLAREEMVMNAATPPSDLSMANNHSAEVKSSTESPEITGSCARKLSFSVPSTSSFSTPTDPLSVQTVAIHGCSTPSRRARRSPGHQLLRQVSDSRILGLKSPNNNSISEGRPSFVLSTCSNDLNTGSHGGSSDGWSMRTFSELVASSQRERWSFDSEFLGSGRSKICGSSSRFSYSPSTDLQMCGACSKILTERPEKIIATNELSVVAVLVCGHVYHADCLETMTLEANRYDPACPICMVGEKQAMRMSRKALRGEVEMKGRNNKISRNRVVDSYLDGDYEVSDYRKATDREGRVPRMEPCSSTRGSFVKPFLKRHFSLGSKRTKPLSENDTSRKKGFWARYRKD